MKVFVVTDCYAPAAYFAQDHCLLKPTCHSVTYVMTVMLWKPQFFKAEIMVLLEEVQNSQKQLFSKLKNRICRQKIWPDILTEKSMLLAVDMSEALKT